MDRWFHTLKKAGVEGDVNHHHLHRTDSGDAQLSEEKGVFGLVLFTRLVKAWAKSKALDLIHDFSSADGKVMGNEHIAPQRIDMDIAHAWACFQRPHDFS